MASHWSSILTASTILFCTGVAASGGAPPQAGTQSELRMCGVLGDKDTHPQVLDWLTRQEWLWGVEVLPSATPESVRRLHDRGLHIVLLAYNHPETRAREAAHKKRPISEPGTVLPRFVEAVGSGLIWVPLLEDDSAGVAFPQQLLRARPRTHAEAKRLFDSYLDVATRPVPGLPRIERWGVCGYASSAHPFATQGLDCVLVERANDDVEDLQTAIAFARGAARQHGTAWGIDLSLWWGPIYGCVQDLPGSLYKRHLYLSYFSGARTFRIEGADLLARSRNGESPVCREIAQFHRTVRHLVPGEAEVPVAVMLPEDSGWMTPPYWRTTSEAWNYARIPYRPGERGIDGFFGAAFPGSVYAMDPFPFGQYVSDDPPASPFSLACVTPEFAPTPLDQYRAEPPLPFGRFESRDQAREHLHRQGTDPAPFRAMADSRWGDMFDVLTESADEAVLARYNALVLLGPVKLGAELSARLRAFVENGGHLLGAAGVFGPSDGELTGVVIQPEPRVGRAWTWGRDPAVHEAYRYLPCSVTETAGAASVLARTQADEPLIVRHRLGKGSVYTCLAPWYEAGHANLSGAAARLFDLVFDEFQPVKVEGMPCDWLSTRSEQGRFVVVANNDGASWRGKIFLRKAAREPRRGVELLTGNVLNLSPAAQGPELTLEVPPYDVRVVHLTP